MEISDSSLAGKTVSVSIVETSNYSGVEGKAYEFVCKVGNVTYSGRMNVTLPAAPVDGKVPVVYYYNNGTLTKMETVSTTDDSITFVTDHNSLYIVGYEDKSSDFLLYIIIGVLVIMVAVIVIATVLKRSSHA